MLGALLAFLAAGCATHHGEGREGKASASGGDKTSPYEVDGDWYRPLGSAQGYQEEGLASWYGDQFHGRPTANGEEFDMHLPTAAHRTLPLPTMVRVTNLENGRSTQVRVNDRGPFVDTPDRIIDLSYAAAKRLGMDKQGVAQVRVEAIGESGEKGPESARNELKDGGNRVYLQVGAFQEEGNAKRLKQRLRDLDLDAVEIASSQRDGSPMFQVRIGPLPGVGQADDLAQRLHRKGLPTGHLVRD
ncbi:MAG: septal ring lytic transglycosylase RlpA family protein [Thiohalorhabdus sp.]|uniref:septal ring lytic transglycosylase RlpA family protein n=1 Tax=Thiohalorhabdus sp. TaxID=3094134 RepID=UPI00397FA6C0